VTTAARAAAIRAKFPGLNQMTSTSSSGASLIRFNLCWDPPQYRCRDASVQASLNSRQLSSTFLARQSTEQPADLRKTNPAVRRNPPPRTVLRHFATGGNWRPRDTVLSQKISQLPCVGLVSIKRRSNPLCASKAPTALRLRTLLILEDLRTHRAGSGLT